MLKTRIWFLFIVAFLVFAACLHSENEPQPAPVHTLNWPADSLTFDTSHLASTLNLKTLPPERVLYYIKTSPEQDSAELQAVLYYEEPIFGKILEKYMDHDFPKGDYKKEEFEFNWLNDTLRAELQLSKPGYQGNPDIFMGTDGKARLWFLNKKILLSTHFK